MCLGRFDRPQDEPMLESNEIIRNVCEVLYILFMYILDLYSVLNVIT